MLVWSMRPSNFIRLFQNQKVRRSSFDLRGLSAMIIRWLLLLVILAPPRALVSPYQSVFPEVRNGKQTESGLHFTAYPCSSLIFFCISLHFFKWKVKFGSKRAIFGVIWGGFEGFGNQPPGTQPTHIWERSSKKNLFFWTPSLRIIWWSVPLSYGRNFYDEDTVDDSCLEMLWRGVMRGRKLFISLVSLTWAGLSKLGRSSWWYLI